MVGYSGLRGPSVGKSRVQRNYNTLLDWNGIAVPIFRGFGVWGPPYNSPDGHVFTPTY